MPEHFDSSKLNRFRRYLLLTEHGQRELFGRRIAETEEELGGVVEELSLKASGEEKLRRICQRRVQARGNLLYTSCWYVMWAQDLISVLGDSHRRIATVGSKELKQFKSACEDECILLTRVQPPINTSRA